MDTDRVKALLKQYQDMTETVYRIEKEIKDIEQSVADVRYMQSAISKNVPSKSSGDATLDKAIQVIELYQKRHKELVDGLANTYCIQQSITDALGILSAEEHKIINLRYFKKIRWDYMSAYMYMSRASCFRLHDKAIAKMVDWFNETDKAIA